MRERFETIMGFQKPDLTASTDSIEKVVIESTEKEAEETKSENIETIEAITPVVTENSDVSNLFSNTFLYRWEFNCVDK